MVLIARSILLLAALLLPGLASAQPFPPPSYPWVLNGHQVNPGGFEIVTAPSTAGTSGFNIPPGTAPTSPINGDVWTTSAGLYVRINGVTIGPLGTGGGGGGSPGGLPGQVQINAGGDVFGGITADNNGILTTDGSGTAGWQNQSSLTQIGTLSGATAVIFNSSGVLQIAAITGSGSSLSLATTTGALVNGDCVSINNNSFVDSGVAGCGSGGGGGSGTVSAGLANQVAYYPSSGTTVAGLAIVDNALLGTNGSGAPSFSTTLPSALTIPSPTFSGTVVGNNTIPLSILKQIATKGVLGNATSGTANVTVAWSVTNTTDSFIPLVHGAVVSADLACFEDSVGTLQDCGTTLPSAIQLNITQVGTIAAGVWHGTLIGSTYGGTGVNNGTHTLTLAGNLTTTGSGPSTLAFPNAAVVATFPLLNGTVVETTTSSTVIGDLVTWNSTNGSNVTDSGISISAQSSYWYPYGLGNAGCFNNPTCTIPTGQTAAGGGYDGTSSNVAVQTWNAARFVNYNSVFRIDQSFNKVGIENGNSLIPAQGNLSGKSFSIRFSSVNIPGSPVTVSYSGTGSDTPASAILNLCNNVIANSAVTNATTEMVCDSNQGGGGFNLQWSVTAAVSTQSVGTGTINLTGPYNLLDGIFIYHNRTTFGYTNQAGDTLYCDEYPAYQECQYVRTSATGTGLANEAQFDMGTPSGLIFTLGLSEGVIIACPSGASPAYAGTGTISICNSANNGSLYFATSAGVDDARIFENGGGTLVLEPGVGGTISFFSPGGVSETLNYGRTTGGAWSFEVPIYFTGSVASTGGNQYVCRNSSTGQVNYQAAAC